MKNNDACQRINYLYQASQVVSAVGKKNEGLARYYSNLMCNISRKSLQKIDYTVKRKVCKKCQSVLDPGVNCIARHGGKRKHVVVTCLICGMNKRFQTPSGKRRQDKSGELKKKKNQTRNLKLA
ncbi:RPP21 (predicted) [Pycnogonum litorale]